MEIQANWAQIQRQVDSAPWGQKSDIVRMYANRFGVSTDKIRRELRERYGKSRNVNRTKKVDPDNEMMRMIFDLKLMGEMMHLKRREVSTEWCIDELIRQGYEEARQLTVSTVNRRLNLMGYRDIQPNMRIESQYANQVHMIDFSRSKYFQLFERDDRKDDWMLIVSGKELHYKKGDERLRTWIVQYMDDYSRIRKVRAYPETNESAFLGLDHLNWCWNPESSDAHLFKYLPKEMLRSDNGAFRKAQETKTAMEAMNVILTKQMPGRKGGTAKVENRFRSLWQQFELPLAIRLGEGGRIWLSEYNELLHEFCIREQQKRHPIYRNQTKGERYQQSLADRYVTQRTADLDLLRLACTVEKRKVDDHLRVSVNNEYYSIPQYVDGVSTTGKWVYIHENQYGELTGKLIDDLATSSFDLEPWEASQWGTFTSFKHSAKRLREEQFERDGIAYNEIVGSNADDGLDDDKRYATDSSHKVRYLGPDTETAEPNSPFNDKIRKTGSVFRSKLDAREYAGIHLETYGLTFNDVSGYFDDVLAELPVLQNDLDKVISQIGQDYDNMNLAANS